MTSQLCVCQRGSTGDRVGVDVYRRIELKEDHEKRKDIPEKSIATGEAVLAVLTSESRLLIRSSMNSILVTSELQTEANEYNFHSAERQSSHHKVF